MRNSLIQLICNAAPQLVSSTPRHLSSNQRVPNKWTLMWHNKYQYLYINSHNSGPPAFFGFFDFLGPHPLGNHKKSIKINEKSIKINKNQRKSKQNQRKSLKIKQILTSKERRGKPQEKKKNKGKHRKPTGKLRKHSGKQRKPIGKQRKTK